ncbi:pancreatic alpha-amylase-like isoform X2 [Labeo rohita]|uniref:alpha-amylase n=1 Tax=Labeo rohita TaxID=84645 RepID=A0A498LYQ5_LABRO|nr:pancreatic alpha-amylase-like isoform X2 [Labeo rohita]RXN25831.1 pancreatic alpha-amylase-like isoform X2 [Labeo rohita]
MKLLILAALFRFSFAQFDPNTKRTAIVHLFEWRWADLAAECERYLGPNGFGGVQISPPSESIIVTDRWHPWWQRYQPIGYNLCSSSGNENELRDMITRCNNVGVNIYADAVINHMCGAGTHSSCGSYFDANNKDFPIVPYFYLDFNDGKCSIGSGQNWDEDWGFMPSDKALVFADNHENQRGRGVGGASIVTSQALQNGCSLYVGPPIWISQSNVQQQDQNDWQGPPSNSDGSTKPVPINPDSTCGDGWVCEHRWCQIKNMVAFRNVVNGQAFSNWWDNGSNQISFSHGSKGFIVFNNDDWELNETLSTGLPAGTYCDVISGQKESGRCTGKQVVVGGDGRASIRISNQEEDPFIAIHADSKF